MLEINFEEAKELVKNHFGVEFINPIKKPIILKVDLQEFIITGATKSEIINYFEDVSYSKEKGPECVSGVQMQKQEGEQKEILSQTPCSVSEGD